jgi:hypothetical protein
VYSLCQYKVDYQARQQHDVKPLQVGRHSPLTTKFTRKFVCPCFQPFFKETKSIVHTKSVCGLFYVRSVSKYSCRNERDREILSSANSHLNLPKRFRDTSQVHC